MSKNLRKKSNVNTAEGEVVACASTHELSPRFQIPPSHEGLEDSHSDMSESDTEIEQIPVGHSAPENAQKKAAKLQRMVREFKLYTPYTGRKYC